MEYASLLDCFQMGKRYFMKYHLRICNAKHNYFEMPKAPAIKFIKQSFDLHR